MARQDLTVSEVSRAGLDIDPATSFHADGMMFLNDGKTYFAVKNSSGTTRTLTFQVERTIDGITLPDLEVSDVADGDVKAFGPFPKDTFDQSGTDAGKVYVDIDAETSVTCMAFR